LAIELDFTDANAEPGIPRIAGAVTPVPAVVGADGKSPADSILRRLFNGDGVGLAHEQRRVRLDYDVSIKRRMVPVVIGSLAAGECAQREHAEQQNWGPNDWEDAPHRS
jgi:hypothetical protein